MPEPANALVQRHLRKSSKSEHIKVSRSATVADAFTLISFSCLRHWRLNEDVLRRQHDPEALHQLHVATRRLHTALLLFRPVVGGKKHRRLMRKLHRFGGLLGHVRDLDLAVDVLGAASCDLDQLKRSREAAYDQIRDVLDSRRHLEFLLRIIRWLLTGKWRQRLAANTPLASFASVQLDRSWERISQQGTRLAHMSDKERHSFRVRIKQFRYALEFLRNVHRAMADERASFRRSLQGVQDKLGLLNDRRMIRRLAPPGCSLPAKLVEQSIQSELVSSAASHFNELLAVGPYWREVQLGGGQ